MKDNGALDIAAMLKHATEPANSRALAVLGKLEKGWLSAWIKSVLSDEIALAHLAERSMWHPNGFLKIVLARGSGGESVRLHVWPPGCQTERSQNIHTHYWNFSSLVLRGQLLMKSYLTAGNGRGRSYRAQELSNFKVIIEVGTSYELYDRGVVTLAQATRRRLDVGEVYCMSADEIHLVNKLGREAAATIVLQGPPVRGKTRVFTHVNTNSKSQSRRAQRAALKSELIDLLSHLHQ